MNSTYQNARIADQKSLVQPPENYYNYNRKESNQNVAAYNTNYTQQRNVPVKAGAPPAYGQ
jgi:hypothetical protein